MCESNAFLKKGGNEEKELMNDVVTVRPEPGQVYLLNILGEELTVKGELDHIDLMAHKIVIREAS